MSSLPIAFSNLSPVSLLTGTIPRPQRAIRSCASLTTERPQRNQITRKLARSKFANWILCFSTSAF
jgi:hypothetical protein